MRKSQRWTTREVAKMPAGRKALGMSEVLKPTKRRGVPNKWEQSFRDEAPTSVLGFAKTDRWRYEAVTFRIGKDRRYTPDWCVTWEHDATMTAFIEVKGSRQAKNARDSITRLRVAAEQWPMFKWGLAEGGPGRWTIEWL